jgi:hypothetical protein
MLGFSSAVERKIRGSFPFGKLRVEDDGEKQATAKAKAPQNP